MTLQDFSFYIWLIIFVLHSIENKIFKINASSMNIDICKQHWMLKSVHFFINLITLEYETYSNDTFKVLVILDGVSCAKLNDLILRNFVRIDCIWKASLLYVYDDVELIHPNEQIATHSHPTDNDRVFHLK